MNDEVKAVPAGIAEARTVTFPDGVTRSFGSKARLISEETFPEDGTGFTITFFTLAGEMESYTYNAGMVVPSQLLQMAAFGAASKAKASTAGVELPNVINVIRGKISEYVAGEFVSRTTPSAIAKAANLVLNKLQTAWARSQGLDTTDVEAVKLTHEHFSTLSTEDKKALEKTTEIRRELARIAVEVATAAYEKLNAN